MHTNRSSFIVRASLLASCLALVVPGSAFTQTDADEQAAKAAAPAAFVYLQTMKGVVGYTASKAGQLTLIKGSPFATVGQMEDANAKYIISVGTTNIHSYPIESNGAIGNQASVVNTQNYGGSQCGLTSYDTVANGSFMDRKGKYLYVKLFGLPNDNTTCTAWQTYEIQSNGEMTFIGDLVAEPSYGPAVSSNDKFVYTSVDGQTPEALDSFVIAKDGVLELNGSFTETDPAPQSGGVYYIESALSDAANHLAVMLFAMGPGSLEELQLASYTIDDKTGGIASTNTWQDMPTPQVMSPNAWGMSPSGKVLAMAGEWGLQFFHFNGAKPITAFGGEILPNVGLQQIGWDNSGHMYAFGWYPTKQQYQIFVYDVTPTSITEAPGSPYVVGPYGIDGATLIVVPK